MSVDFDVNGHVATITLNRPEAMNAIDPETSQGLAESWRRVREDDNIRVVILTGAGDRAFSAGADLKKTIPKSGDKTFAQQIFGSEEGVGSFRNLTAKPIIAAINGVAVGGGLELAMCCDLRIAADHARIGLPEVKVGSIPGGGGTQRLPRMAGLTNALMLLMTGDIVPVEEGYRMGVINKIVPKDDLMDEVNAIAERIASNAPLAVRAVKRLAYEGQRMSLEAGLDAEMFAMGVLRNSKDRIEGRVAFKEKRKPVYRGE